MDSDIKCTASGSGSSESGSESRSGIGSSSRSRLRSEMPRIVSRSGSVPESEFGSRYLIPNLDPGSGSESGFGLGSDRVHR